MMKISIKLYIFFLLFFTLGNVYSQKKINVITKTIVKEFVYSGETFIIQGEKSNIHIRTWNEKKIKVEIRLIAKNPIESKAKKDLDVMQYAFQNDAKSIKVKNYFKSNEANDITSNLSTEYSVYIPNKCNIQLTNIYGAIEINNTEVAGSIKNSFGNLELNNTLGNLEIELYFTTLNANNLSGKFKFQTKNSDILIKKISGDYILNTVYGSIEIITAEKLNNLTINAQRTKVFITVNKSEDYNYTLSTQYDKIIVPSEYTKSLKEESGLLKFIKASSSINKSIKISTTFCPITLKIN